MTKIRIVRVVECGDLSKYWEDGWRQYGSAHSVEDAVRLAMCSLRADQSFWQGEGTSEEFEIVEGTIPVYVIREYISEHEPITEREIQDAIQKIQPLKDKG